MDDNNLKSKLSVIPERSHLMSENVLQDTDSSNDSESLMNESKESRIEEFPKIKINIKRESAEDNQMVSSFTSHMELLHKPSKSSKKSKSREYLGQPITEDQNQFKIRSTAQENVIDIENHTYSLPFEFTENEIREAFDTLDIHKNNFITAAELKLFLEILGISASEEEVDEMIRMADNQGVGKVYFDEFLELGKGRLLSPIGLAYPPSIPLLEKKNLKINEYSKDSINALFKQKTGTKRLSFIKEKEKDEKWVSKPKKNSNSQGFNIPQVRQERIKNLKNFFDESNFNFTKLLEKYKEMAEKNKNANALDHNAFVDFFDFQDKRIAKNLFSTLQWHNNKYLDIREILINWVTLQNWSVVNKAFLAYYVIDIKEKGCIDFEEFMDIIIWLNIICQRANKERILKKIWEKFKINIEENIDQSLYEKIIQNFGNVLFHDIDEKE